MADDRTKTLPYRVPSDFTLSFQEHYLGTGLMAISLRALEDGTEYHLEVDLEVAMNGHLAYLGPQAWANLRMGAGEGRTSYFRVMLIDGEGFLTLVRRVGDVRPSMDLSWRLANQTGLVGNTVTSIQKNIEELQEEVARLQGLLDVVVKESL